MRPPQHRTSRWLLLAALVVELVVVAWLVLNPSPAVPSAAVEDVSAALAAVGLPGWLTDTSLVEFVLNVGLFVPLGITLALLLPRVPWWMWMLIGLAVSSGIEALQLFFLADRSPTLRDVWANTLGLGLGALVTTLATRQWRGVVASRADSPTGLRA